MMENSYTYIHIYYKYKARMQTEFSSRLYTFLITDFLTCIGSVWQGFGSGGVEEWLSEKLLGASPMSNRAGASQLQDGPLGSAEYKAHQ